MIRNMFWSILAILLGCSTAVADDIRRVVTGLDDNNHAVVLYDSRVPLKSDAFGIASANFWITDSYPPSLLKADTANRLLAFRLQTMGQSFVLLNFRRWTPKQRPKCPLR